MLLRPAAQPVVLWGVEYGKSRLAKRNLCLVNTVFQVVLSTIRSPWGSRSASQSRFVSGAHKGGCLSLAADAPIANFVGPSGCRRERAIVHEPVLLAS